MGAPVMMARVMGALVMGALVIGAPVLWPFFVELCNFFGVPLRGPSFGGLVGVGGPRR